MRAQPGRDHRNHIERFAPSPSGWLHLGHIYSAFMGYARARAAGGKWLLRIEDIDFTRCKPEYEQAIFDDLSWLGFRWDEPVMRQSDRMNEYQQALEELRNMGVIYGCRCTRGDIRAAQEEAWLAQGGAPGKRPGKRGDKSQVDIALSAPHADDTSASAPLPNYPGTCRELGLEGENLAMRIDTRRALSSLKARGRQLSYHEMGEGEALQPADPHLEGELVNIDAQRLDDVVLARRDIGVSYHLAVVVDDAAQGVTHVTRGQDLEAHTGLHVLLQSLLGFPTPIYHHHKLLTDNDGKRLAKRDAALSVRALREKGLSRDAVLEMAGLPAAARFKLNLS